MHGTMAQGPAEQFNIGEMIFHHTRDAHELDFQPFGTIALPQFAPIHIGSLSIDMSPTKHVVFMLLAATIVVVGLSSGAFARLPRAGMWMVWVKRLFALVMICVAEYYLVKMGQLII